MTSAGLLPPAQEDELVPRVVLRVVTALPALSPLTRIRVEAGLTIGQLARSLHVSRPTVSAWERGIRAPAPHYWPSLARALHVDQEQVRQLFLGYPAARLDGVRLPSLAHFRRGAGLTQRALAARVGAAPSTFAMWESGRVPVPHGTASELAKALLVPLDRLAVATTPQPDPRPLRRLRTGAGMTRPEAAAHLGISIGTLSRYEAGERRVPVPVARRMAVAYGRPAGQLLRLCGCPLLPVPPGRRWRAEEVPAGITALRTSAGMSKEALGRAVQRSGQAVRGWESGRSRPSPATCRRLETIFRLSPGTLPF